MARLEELGLVEVGRGSLLRFTLTGTGVLVVETVRALESGHVTDEEFVAAVSELARLLTEWPHRWRAAPRDRALLAVERVSELIGTPRPGASRGLHQLRSCSNHRGSTSVRRHAEPDETVDEIIGRRGRESPRRSPGPPAGSRHTPCAVSSTRSGTTRGSRWPR